MDKGGAILRVFEREGKLKIDSVAVCDLLNQGSQRVKENKVKKCQALTLTVK